MAAADPSSEPIGPWLRRQREACGLTQDELAARSGLSVRALSDLERGRSRRPYPRSIRVLVKALGLPDAVADELVARLRAGTGVRTPARPAAEPEAPVRPVVVPRQLPPAAAHFVGRAPELAAMDTLLDRADGDGDPPGVTAVVVAVEGTAGVGKTALALRWAHRVTDRFPDGQLYVNLRGFDPSAAPMEPDEVLGGFLVTLGVAADRIPADTEARAGLYRSLLAERRMLVVLDNARDAAQLRPLLPGGPGCAALVTSRDSLAGLVARDGAVRLALDVLSPGEAHTLLHDLVGVRVRAEPGPAADLAGLCGRLPLALRVAAELVTTRPATPLAVFAAELSDQRRRLDRLGAGGDGWTDVRSVFSWSYRHLSRAAARTFRLTGLHPGPDFDASAVAALTATEPEPARATLDELCRAHLLHHTGVGRYGMHDLLRAYAAELAAEDFGAGDGDRRRDALTAMFDYYVGTATRAVADDEPTARAWLDAERANLVAVATHASAVGMGRYATELSTALYRYLDNGGHLSEAQAVHSSAVRGASGAEDSVARAHALINLGGAAVRRTRHDEAAAHYRQALALCREAGDRLGELRALGSLAGVDQREGRYPEAAGRFRQVLDLCRDLGAAAHEARTLTCLGQIALLCGHLDEAAGHFGQALERCGEIGDHDGRAHALIGLAEVDLRQDRYGPARVRLLQARAVYRRTGNRTNDVQAVYYLGWLELREGHHERAAELLDQAREAFHDSGDRGEEAHALCRLGELDAALGRHDDALQRLGEALDLCRQTGDRAGEAQALNALGEALLAVDRPRPAADRYAQALSLATGIGATDEQHRARRGLAAAGEALRALRQR